MGVFIKTMDKKMFIKGKCYHRHTFEFKVYRKNYPHGRKSEVKHYDPPRIIKEICIDCGKELERWKP